MHGSIRSVGYRSEEGLTQPLSFMKASGFIQYLLRQAFGTVPGRGEVKLVGTGPIC